MNLRTLWRLRMLHERDNSESCGDRANCVEIRKGNVLPVKMMTLGVRGISKSGSQENSSNQLIDA